METSTVDQEPDRSTQPVSGRGLAFLRAVAAGRAELSVSCEPDLYIDGLSCGDQYTAHQLARAGLLRTSAPGVVGQRVRAELTSTGHAVLAAVLRVSA